MPDRRCSPRWRRAVPARPRTRPWRAAAVTLAGLVLLLAQGASTGAVDAAFTASTGRPGNALTSDTLDPPTGLAATRPCLAPAPQFVSVATAAVQATSVAVARPAGVLPGDVLLAFVQHHDSSSVPSVPDGWTVLRRSTSTPGQSLLAGRVTGDGEPGSYTFTGLDGSDSTAAAVLAYRGVDPATPWEQTASRTTGTASVTAPSVQPATAATRWVTGFLVDHYVGAITPPPGGTGRASVLAPGPQESQLLVADREHAVLTATGDAVATLASAEAATGFSVLLRSSTPAAAVTLSWAVTPDAYAAGYEVQRQGQSSVTTVSPRTATGAVVTDLPAASTATFTVRSAAGTWRSDAPQVTVPAC